MLAAVLEWGLFGLAGDSSTAWSISEVPVLGGRPCNRGVYGPQGRQARLHHRACAMMRERFIGSGAALTHAVESVSYVDVSVLNNELFWYLPRTRLVPVFVTGTSGGGDAEQYPRGTLASGRS